MLQVFDENEVAVFGEVTKFILLLLRITFGRPIQLLQFEGPGQGTLVGKSRRGGGSGSRSPRSLTSVEDTLELGDAPNLHTERYGLPHEVVIRDFVCRPGASMYSAYGFESSVNDTHRPLSLIGLLRSDGVLEVLSRDLDMFSLLAPRSSEGIGLFVMKCVIALEKKSSICWPR